MLNNSKNNLNFIFKIHLQCKIKVSYFLRCSFLALQQCRTRRLPMLEALKFETIVSCKLSVQVGLIHDFSIQYMPSV